MADDRGYWFNKVGKVAPTSNPGSAIPNYGLTYDIATAPYDGPDQFDVMAESLGTYLSSMMVRQVDPSVLVGRGAPEEDKTVWDRMTDAASFVADAGKAAVGGIQQADAWANQYLPEWAQDEDANEAADEADAAGLSGVERLLSMGESEIAQEVTTASTTPGFEQIFWGLEKLNEYASTTFVAATLAEDDPEAFFKSGTWGDANALTKERHLNAGESFVQMFYDKELILDEERFEQMREHNTVFNVGALAFNVVAAWKADPNVILGQTVGKARDLAVGKIAPNGRTAEVQRNILAQPDIDTARTVAGEYTGLADKLRAAHSVSLYDRAQQLRTDAQSMGFEDFKKKSAFRSSASGVTMAKLMQDVADDDEAWNLVFRSAIGDPDAVGELITRQGAVSDKIAAIELRSMPRTEADLERVEMRYQKRLAEQGKPQDAAIEITRFGDRWLDDEVSDLRAESARLSDHLSTYETHESWLQRALPGLDEDAGTLNRNAPNSIFGNLDRLGEKGAVRRSLPSLGGKVKMWQHDDYSPASWVVRAPTKPFLNRVGVVSLNDVDEGAGAVASYLDQMDYIQGGSRQGFRDDVLGRFAGATTDMERKAVVEQVERSGIKALGQKYNLSGELMERLGRELQTKRGKSWSRFSDSTMYSPIPGKSGPGFVDDVDDAGNMIRVKMPVDPTQLPNFHPLTNLTDLDRTIRQNLDVLRDLDSDLVTRHRAGAAWTERHVTDFVDTVGSHFNAFWKPLALLSIRWPTRVVADESMRVMLLAGVLPHLAHWKNSAGNAMWNNGVVRPYEYWNGRRVKTGSLAEESLRPQRNDFDAYDYRAVTNPNAAVPVDALDFGKLDKKRYNKLNLATSERWSHLRSLEADRFRATTAPAERPKWAQRWDEKLDAAEASTERGFFFDPINPNRGVSKGFAVSVYPGRMRTFPRKPTAREMNFWTEKNSDLLSVPNSRAAVWLDRDTGRWHLDVVKTAKRREDAMLLASKAEATEFYDIEDGFTRYMSEDFYNHFDSPFVKPPATAPLGGAATDQAPILNAADAVGSQIGAAVDGYTPIRKQTGFGTKKWRTRDGREVEGEDVFGADTKNANIYYSVVSSREAMQALYGGHTKGIGQDRASRTGTDWRAIDPDDPDTDPNLWASAYADFVNNHIRYSPIGERMLAGQSDDEIYEWLMGTSKGRAARKRVPIRGENPDKWVSDVREIFDHMFPTERALEAARLGELDAKRVLDLLPEGERPFVHGELFKLGFGTSGTQTKIAKVIDGLMTYLGSVPVDGLVRHPFAATVYNREMRNYLSSVPADKVTNNVLAAAEASARAKAVKQVRRVLYNIADEREGVHLLRFVSPFFQAQVEVLERYAKISMEKPETMARIAQLLAGSQTLQSPFWEVTDREGNKAEGYSNDNQVVFQVNETMRGLVNKFPGLQGALDNAGQVNVPVASLNLVLQGDKPYLPSMGPLVVYPASEFVFKDRPEMEDSFVYKWLYPFGAPKGSNFAERGVNTVIPAWMKRAATGGTTDFDDSAFARRTSEIGAQQLIDWELGGKEGPRPTPEMALAAAKAEYNLRAASSFFMPAPMTPRSPYQFWIDQYRAYKEKYGLEADEKFYDEFGPTYFMFAQQATQASGGMGPNVGEKRAYDKYKSLAQRAPLLTGVLTGPFATDEFSDAVYQWQLSTRSSATSNKNLREHLDPAARIADAETSRGWVEYGKLSSALQAELRNRVAQGGSPYLTATSNADLAAIKDEKWREIVDRNPAWQDAYNSRSEDMGAFLGQAYEVAFDAKLDGRTDIEAMRTYLISRARLQDALREREDTGQSSSDQFSYDPLGNPIGDNADLAVAWQSYVTELTSRNLLFAEIYTRYLEGDDLSTYISPEVSNAS